MAHDHTHSHSHTTGRVLFLSLLATVAFVVVEAIAGFHASSLALLSDAGHNFTDAFALLLAAFGFYLQARPGDHVKTYGYQRAGVLAAFVNALALVVLAGFLFYESYVRLMNPQPVAEKTMMVVAAIGLALNLAIACGLGGHGHDLNLRAAWLHMLGDAASSAGIIAGAIAIHYTGWLAIDPVLSILIGIGIVWSAWDIIKDSLNILLEGLPKGLKPDGGDRRAGDGSRGDRRARSAHLESGIGSARAELPRADRGHAAVGERIDPAAHQSGTVGPLRDPPHHHPVRAHALRAGGRELRRARPRAALT